MKLFTRISLITGIILIAYGYLARMLHLYFFWDGKAIGLFFLAFALMGFLFDIIRTKRIQCKKITWPMIAVSVLIFGMVAAVGALVLMKNSDAYIEATEYLKEDAGIRADIGDVKGFGLFPNGAVSTTSVNGAESGDAEFHLTVRGTKKYKDITIVLTKTPETFWAVVSVE